VLKTLSDEERQCVILELLPQVRLVARRIHSRLPHQVSLDDLVSTGILGLISAIDSYDPSRNVSLRTYAEFKIRGAILDSLRRLDWAPRRQRRQAKQIKAATALAEQRWQRLPTDEEVATELNLRMEVYRRWQAKLPGWNVASLGSADCDSESLASDERACPAAAFERNELKGALAAAIAGLSRIRQVVLRLYYRDELRPREISRITGLHETRVYRIRRQAILQLRACMSNPRGQ